MNLKIEQKKKVVTGKVGDKNACMGGFTILYAVLIASLLLSIGVSIYSLVARDFALSATASQSQIAIFAADTGYECALYWDIKGRTVGDNPIFSPNTTAEDLAAASYPCAYDENIANGWTQTRTTDTAVTTFVVHSSTATVLGPCSKVVVTRQEPVTGARKTTIDSRGYNTCDDANPRRVERAIRTTYQVN